MHKLSVIIITKNEEQNIRACLESVRWADEIVMVDSYSTDNTIAIAKEFNVKIFQRDWDGFGAAKNFAMSQSVGEWILWLDADERVTPELREEILSVLALEHSPYAAYSMPRRANFLGAWINHCGWYPGRVERLFKKFAGKISATKVHEHLEIDGAIGAFKNNLLHYTDPDLFHYYEKYNRYTTLAAEELADRGKKFHLSTLLFNPVWIFIKMYFIRLGFLDGIPGLILCVCSANYVFTKYAKHWELSKQGT
ncbi:MAG TPA: glycosyltransferase family 2 protein [Bacteroidota bacterium]|nr:glycosyltransferase family 2 protein [Bacteroidota bacterium]